MPAETTCDLIEPPTR